MCEKVRTLEELLRISDLVTLHVPLTDETRHMIGALEIALMKKNAVLVNTCRGGVVATPHVAGNTFETQERSALWVAQQAVDFLQGKPPEPANRVA